MQNPGYVTMNGLRIKVQRWQQELHVITFTTVIRGEQMANDIVATTAAEVVTLVVDDETTVTGRPRLLNRRASGVGPTAVVRLEIQFTVDGDTATSLELTQGQKLDAILAELRALRREVAILGGRLPMSTENVTPPAPGKTMLDFEIPAEEME